MSIPPDVQRKMRETTREAAAAFIEDMEHFREVLKRTDPIRGELRRLSGALRRLLVERDIAKIATPRIGRIMIAAPDNKPLLKAGEKAPYLFVGSGGIDAFGMMIPAEVAP